MEKDRKYSFTINGLTETIGQVEILSARLGDVEKQLDTLSNKRININVGSSGGGRTTSSKDMTLEENKALEEQKQIRRQLTKEVQEMIAADRLQSNQYAETLNGMRQKLADLKRALGGVAVGSEKFDKLIAETDALNAKVKELEGSYGVFQRNVGNYANSFREAMSPLQVTIQGIEYQFGSFREAMRALSMELATLKATGQGESERYAEIAEKLEEMKKQYKEIDSTLKDMDTSSQVMDDMLDTFQSFTALASMSKGLSTFFGFDDAEMQKSIQQLLALQNVLQGIEAIRQQMITKEGLGKYLASANSAINKFSTSLLGTKTALNGVAAAEAQATVASKALGAALKGIGIGLLIAALPYLVDGLTKVVKKFTDWVGITKDLEGELKNLKTLSNIADVKAVKEIDEATADYYRGAITQAEYLNRVTSAQTENLKAMAAETKKAGEANDNFMLGIKGWALTGKGSIEESFEANRDNIGKFKDGTEAAINTENNFKRSLEGAAGAFVRFVKEGKLSNEQLAEMIKNTDALGYLFAHLDDAINDTALAEKLRNIYNSVFAFNPAEPIANMTQQTIDAMEDSLEKYQMKRDKAIYEVNHNLAMTEAGRQQEINKINAEYSKNVADFQKREKEKSKQHYKELSDQAKRQEQELYDIEIAAMKEGLAKILLQLEHERQERLNKASQNIKDVSLLQKAKDTINATYDKKEKEAREKHQQELEKQEREFAQRMAALDKETLETRLSAFETENERMLQTYLDRYRTKLLPQLQKQMDEESIYKLVGASDGEMIKASADMYNLLLKQNYEYLKARKEQTRKSVIEEQKLQLKALLLEENSDAGKRSDAMNAEVEALKKEELTLEEYNKKKAEVETRYNNLSAAKAKEYAEKRIAILEAGNQKLIDADKDYYNWAYNARETAYARLNALSQKQPETNVLGLPSLSKTKKNFQDIEDAYRQMLKDIWEEQKDLTDQVKNGDIGFDEFQTLNDQLEGQKHEIIESLNDLKKRMSNTAVEVIQEYVQVISQYSQMIGQTILSIMQSNNDLEDKIYQHRIDELNKFIDNYDEALQRQQEITQKHNDALKSADEELDTARGDRRDQLIDIINAEVQAQRASLAEEKRIEKEKERLQKQVEQEEKKQREREWQRSLNQALINSALSITSALATQPFIPAGLAAAALASLLSGIQIANIRAQRQYLADGGVIVGNAHSHGGVKVLGGQAEVEGGEYIVNKRSTAKNADLLTYINSKKRRVTLADMDAFFNGARNSFTNHSTKFANGGQLPNIQRNVNDNLASSLRQLVDRPVVVSVEEIERVQDGVTRVRALAGAEE